MAMPITHRRFTVDDYHRMVDAGILREDDRVELLDGEVVEVSPIGPHHARCVDLLNRLFVRGVGDRAIVRVQGPIGLSSISEPEPDVALLRYGASGYGDAHPTPPQVLLLIEVSDTTLAYDRGRKLPAYARAGIAETWIVNLAEDQIEIHREPRGERYAGCRTARRGETIAPLAFPDLTLDVTAILG